MIRRSLLNLGVLCLGILLALALGEGLARYLHPLSTVEYRIDPEVGQILVSDQKSRWVNQDYDVMIHTNSAGFHDVEHELKKPHGVYRIVVLGDSFIEALQLPIQEGFSQQLERMLQEEKGTRVEVINLGTSGNGPSQYFRMLEVKGLNYKPDLVVMAVLPDNDFRDSYQALSGAVFKPYYSIHADGKLQYIPPQSSGVGATLRPILRQSAFLHLLRQGIATMRMESWFASAGLLAPAGDKDQSLGHAMIPEEWYVYVSSPPEPWPDAYRVTLRMIKESKELAEEHGAQFLVMLIASTQTVEQRWELALRSYSEAKMVTWDFGKPYREIVALGNQWGFASISLLEPFQRDFRATGQSHSWPHDGHWNQRGHKLAAEVVSTYLLAHRAEYRMN